MPESENERFYSEYVWLSLTICIFLLIDDPRQSPTANQSRGLLSEIVKKDEKEVRKYENELRETKHSFGSLFHK